MSKRHRKESKQLSLTLEPEPKVRFESSVSITENVHIQSATVFPFPLKEAAGASFRERIIRELASTRVMLSD